MASHLRLPVGSRRSHACRTRRRSTTTRTSRRSFSRRLPRQTSRMCPIGAVSKGSKARSLADIAELKQAGCVAITDDGHPVSAALLLRRALECAGMFGIPVIEHCEDATLKGDGVAHEGFHASSLGLRGFGSSEALGVERGVLLSELTGSAFRTSTHERSRVDTSRAQGQRGGRASPVKSRRIISR